MKKNTKKNLKQTQEVVIRLLLVAINIIVMATVAVAVAKMSATGFSLLHISADVRYEENLHDQFMQAGEGHLAEECDQRILQLYAERNELINSTDTVVAFAATHQFLAFIGIVLFFSVVGFLCVLRHMKIISFSSIFIRILDVEAFILRLAIFGFCLIVTKVSYIIYVASDTVMSQTKPKRKKRRL